MDESTSPMIEANEIREFVPWGQHIAKQIPSQYLASSTTGKNHQQCLLRQIKIGNSVTSQHSHFSFLFSKLEEESYIGEEELYFDGHAVIWSKHDGYSHGSQILKIFIMDSPVKQALWATLEGTNPRSGSEEQREMVCIVEDRKLSFYDNGDACYRSIPFNCVKVWVYSKGLLIERSVLEKEKKFPKDPLQMPGLFSLTHPQGDFEPVLIKNSSGSRDVKFTSCDLRIIGICEDTDLVLAFDFATMQHVVFHIVPCEAQDFEKLADTYRSLCVTPSPASGRRDFQGRRSRGGLAEKVLTRNLHLKLAAAGDNSELLSPIPESGIFRSTPVRLDVSGPLISTPQQASSSTVSSLSLPTAMPSVADTTPRKSTRSQRVSSQVRGERLPFISDSVYGQADSNVATPSKVETPQIMRLVRLGREAKAPEQREFSQFCQPSMSLVALWKETEINEALTFEDKGGVPEPSPAKKFFLTSDVGGYKYLCYFISTSSELHYIRLQQGQGIPILSKEVHRLSAVDVENLPGTKFYCVIAPSRSLLLYSGCVKMIKISTRKLSLFQCVFPTKMTSKTKPYKLKRLRSIQSVNKYLPADNDEEPINGDQSMKAPKKSVFHREEAVINEICNGVSNRLTISATTPESRDPLSYRISVPNFASSSLVCTCLFTLSQVLDHDKYMSVHAKWLQSRFCPGTIQKEGFDFEEWNTFKDVILFCIGYRCGADSGPLFRGTCETNTTNKRSKTFRTRESSVWLSSTPQFIAVRQMFDEIYGIDQKNLIIPGSEDDTKTQLPHSSATTVDPDSLLYEARYTVLHAFHLVYEDLKLNIYMTIQQRWLGELLFIISRGLQLAQYIDYYVRQYPELRTYTPVYGPLEKDPVLESSFPNQLKEPSSIFKWLYDYARKCSIIPYPYIFPVTGCSRNIILLYSVLRDGEPITLKTFNELLLHVELQPPNIDIRKYNAGVENCTTKYELVVHYMHKFGLTKSVLRSLPPSIVLPITEAILHCRRKLSTYWPASALHLIGREDVALLSEIGTNFFPEPADDRFCNQDEQFLQDERKSPMTLLSANLDLEMLGLRFEEDRRLYEVTRMLQSSEPVVFRLIQGPGVDDVDFIEEKERKLFSFSVRTLSLSVGRGMLTLATAAANISDPLPIPRLNLSGRIPPKTLSFQMRHLEIPPQTTWWPLFHNGVASGLCVAPKGVGNSFLQRITTEWICFNRPRANNEVDAALEHAGFFLALGLNGHLANMQPNTIHEYISRSHSGHQSGEFTTAAVILGLAASRRGSMDQLITRVIAVHMESLLPFTELELNIPHIVQVSAVMALGLLYEGTGDRHMVEILLEEIGRSAGPEMDHGADRESYSLAAGLALGMISFGEGSQVSHSSSYAITQRLYQYIDGGVRSSASGRFRLPSYQVKEGDTINVHVTCPGATLALGMIFFNSHNESIAAWLKPPQTFYALESIRPDFLILRVIAHSLIMWQDVHPTIQWVESHLPNLIKNLNSDNKIYQEYEDQETLIQAHLNILAGACSVLGLKYAGTSNPDAVKVLVKYLYQFNSLMQSYGAELAGLYAVESALDATVMALGMVMAGTGSLHVLRICRSLRQRIGSQFNYVPYGSHMANHMALGLLFLGGGRYTLSTTKPALGAMICAFYHKLPMHSRDNRYHLQAFRHLYVLAAEPRLIIPRDIVTRRPCYVHILIKYKSAGSKMNKMEEVIRAPAMLPSLDLLEEVTIIDERYWQVVFQQAHNFDVLRSLLNRDGNLFVRQKAGCLPYTESSKECSFPQARDIVKHGWSTWYPDMNTPSQLTNSPGLLMLADSILNLTSNVPEEEAEQLHLIHRYLHDCIIHEKLEVFPVFMYLANILKERRIDSLDRIWMLKLANVFARHLLKDPCCAAPGLYVAPAIPEHFGVIGVPETEAWLEKVKSQFDHSWLVKMDAYIEDHNWERLTPGLSCLLVLCDVFDVEKVKDTFQNSSDLIAIVNKSRKQQLPVPVSSLIQILKSKIISSNKF